MQSLKPGSLLQGGKYKIECKLGQGGFGITYLAIQDILDRKVAIKEFFFREYCERDGDTSHVTLGTQSNRDTVERFLNKFIKEARTISQLRHPSIIPIFDVFRENGTAYYVMEYVEGESLRDMVNDRGALPQEEALSYIRGVGDALIYIHQRKINHLDVKPGNIMVRYFDKKVMLIDFGTAKQYDEESKEWSTTTPVGISHGYSPAEQYIPNGVRSFSPQSDVYALAATLFKLLTGQNPPEATEIPDVGLPLDGLRQKGVSETVIQAIVQAMKPRSTRTKSVTEFLDNLCEMKEKAAPVIEDEETEVFVPASKPAPKPKPAPEPKQKAKAEPRQVSVKYPVSKSRPVWPYTTAIVAFVVCVGLWWLLGRGTTKSSAEQDMPSTEISEVEQEEKTPANPIQNDQVKKVSGQKTTILLGKSFYECVYTGEVDSLGKPHGNGKATFSDGRYYRGPFVHGIAEGNNAYFKYKNGDIFEGSFRNGHFEKGRYTTEEGSYCEGSFNEDGELIKDQGKWYDKSGKEIE